MYDFLHSKKILLLSFSFIFLLIGCTEQSRLDTDIKISANTHDITFSFDEQTVLMHMVRGEKISPINSHANEVIVVLWKNGRRVGVGQGESLGLTENIERARDAALEDAGLLIHDMGALDSHLFVLGGWQAIDTGYIHGLHAVMLKTIDKEIRYRPSYAIETNRDYSTVVERMCRDLGGYEPTCTKRTEVQVLYAPALHIAMDDSTGVLRTYYRGKILASPQKLTKAYLATILSSGYQWLWENVSGDFTYVYNPSSGMYSKNNNMIRQFMASRLLAEMAHEDEDLLEKHRENITYIFDHRYQEDSDRGWVYFNKKSKLGAIAMLLRVLAASPLSDEYTGEAEKLMTTILSLMEEDGSFDPRYIEPNYRYDTDYLLTFYSGEAILALVEAYQKWGDEKTLEAALRAQDFYLQRYVYEIDDRYYPAYVPRHTLSLYHLYHITGDERYAAAIFTLNDKIIDEMLHTDVFGLQDIVGRFYNPLFAHYGTPHSASDGVYLEGLVYAYMLAHESKDDKHIQKYGEALELAVHNIAQLQYQPGDMYFLSHPERVVGAIRFGADDNRIRTDTTQHSMDGLRVLENFLQ